MNRKLKKPVKIVLILTIILLGSLIFLFSLNRYPKNLTTTDETNKNFGNHEILKDKSKEYTKVFHYPKTNLSSINDWTNKSMDVHHKIIEDNNSSKKIEAKQDYEITDLNNFVSLKLILEIDGNIINEAVQTFNKEKNDTATISQLFTSQGNKFITSTLRSNFTDNGLKRSEFLKKYSADNFINFFLDKDSIDIYKKEKILSIDLEDTVTFLKNNIGSYEPKEGFVPSVYTDRGVDPKQKLVALTFDDGPHFKYTEKIMHLLEAYDGQATFFVLGQRAEENDSHRRIIKNILDRGHQLANHSYNHTNFNSLSLDHVNQQIDKTNEIFHKATGYPGPYMVRPPYGSINQERLEEVNSVFINWSVDIEDWRYRDPNKICQKIKNEAYDGGIILMHDLYEATYKGLDCALEYLSNEGFTFVTVEELLKARGIDYKTKALYYEVPKQ